MKLGGLFENARLQAVTVIFIAQFLIANPCIADSALPIVVLEVGTYAQWKPTPDQIEGVEGALKLIFDSEAEKLSPHSLIPRAGLAAYGRQYLGKSQGGRAIIEVIGFCQMAGHTSDELKTRPLEILDGGACFFRGEFNPKTERFERFYFHGEG